MTNHDFAIRVAVSTLAIVLVAVVTVLMFGLFDPRVDNDKILAIVGPAFDMIVGCFVTLLATKALKKQPADKDTA